LRHAANHLENAHCRLNVVKEFPRKICAKFLRSKRSPPS